MSTADRELVDTGGVRQAADDSGPQAGVGVLDAAEDSRVKIVGDVVRPADDGGIPSRGFVDLPTEDRRVQVTDRVGVTGHDPCRSRVLVAIADDEVVGA